MAESATTGHTAVLDQRALEGWGRAVGEGVVAGELALPLVVALRGPLGAGKSVLARAIARGAGVESPMPSPSYNLLFIYDGAAGVTVQHVDLYRLEHPDDVWELGWQELGEGHQVALVEWPERAEELLPRDRWEVRLSFPESEPVGGADDGGAGTQELRVVEVEGLGSVPEPPPLPGAGP